jgi:flagellar hook-associated protein 2
MAADIGLEIDRDGHLSLDSETLTEALTDNYFAVLSLVGAVGTGGSSDSAIQFNSAASSTTPGVYEVKVEFDGTGTITAAYMRGEGETEWREATVDGTVITGATDNPEQGLTTTFVWDGVTTSPITAEVRVQQGFAGGIYDEMDEMLDPVDGTLALKVERYEKAISDLDDRIESWEDRLDVREEALREKYARLEANMARLDSMRAAVDALVSSLAQTGGSQKKQS